MSIFIKNLARATAVVIWMGLLAPLTGIIVRDDSSVPGWLGAAAWLILSTAAAWTYLERIYRNTK